jgi:hypothetical protein
MKAQIILGDVRTSLQRIDEKSVQDLYYISAILGAS